MYVSSHSQGENRPPPTVVQTLGQTLKAARVRAGLTQEELAEKLKITQSQVSKAERDFKGSELRAPMLILWAGACDVSPQLLMPKTAPRPKRHDQPTSTQVRSVKPGALHPSVRASLEDYLERKGHILSDVQRQRLPVLARGIDPDDEQMPVDDEMWDSFADHIYRRYRDKKAS